MKIINIVISPSGVTKIETVGFVGSECRVASQFLETALGRRASERLTTEFHSSQSSNNTQTQKEG
ncbi:DUF2997 domain-containing protein [Rosistilla carotiformis]|uniref:DUF2997 domain-containing protein n=1 Tax=Rosistilla carotiformis TaxID=2528017 RepID=UPI0011A60A4B|nr:DUF2997 domain-containing protein [Rosistilla carotiformis]